MVLVKSGLNKNRSHIGTETSCLYIKGGLNTEWSLQCYFTVFSVIRMNKKQNKKKKKKTHKE